MNTFRVLEALSKNPNMSQKDIASLCEISIGKVNYTLNQLAEQGLIEVKKPGKRYIYSVTEKGMVFLKNELERLQSTKVTLHGNGSKAVKQAVILAAGAKTEFGKPVCLLDFDGITLLERNIEILERNGIENFVIVRGYKKEEFEKNKSLINKPNIVFAENPRYEWTGSMASLAAAAEHITDDFVLIEDDILIEENAIARLIHQESRDCILVTKESGSGDEAYIEVRNGYLYKISKDIHQLNRIDGEMMGVTKFSIDVFNEMMEMYKHNRNQYLNYEYMLLDVSRKIDVGFLKINDLIWSEIDNMIHYEKVVDKFYPMLKRKEAEYREMELKQLISEALNIKMENISEVKPFGGMTNKNYKVTINGEEFVARISGNGTEKMINRMEEKLNAELGCRLGINADQIYFNEFTGLKIARMIPDAETLNPKTAKREDNFKKIAKIFRTLHFSGEKMHNKFDAFEKLFQYEELTKEASGHFYEDYQSVRAQVMELKKFYDSLNIELKPCHIDPVPENFIKSGEEKMFLIDWEYSGMNDPMWDVGAFLLECEFSPAEEVLFLLNYLERSITIEHRQRVLLNKIFQDFLWSVWTVLKEAKGDDFGSYGISRYNRAKANINEFNKLFKGVEVI